MNFFRYMLLWALLVALVAGPGFAAETPLWKAGTAKANITPDQPLWMAGYGGRDKPADGKVMESVDRGAGA